MGYQTSFLSRLEEDVPLDGNVVLLGDPRWPSALREFRRARWFGLDTEFYEAGRGPWKVARDIDYWRSDVRLIQVGLPSGLTLVANLGGIFDDRDRCREAHLPFLRVLKLRGEDPDVPVYGMSLLTEYMLLRIGYGIALRGLRDVMLASQVLWAGVRAKGKRWTRTGPVMEPRLKHSLSAICTRLGVEIEKGEQKSDWAGRLTNRQLNYAGRDPHAPVECWRKLTPMIRADGLERSVRAETDAQAAFCECEFNGLPVDGPRLLRDLEDWATVRDFVWADFRKRFPSANPRSPQDVARAFQEALDVRTCGGCGHRHDPLARREPPDWRPPGAFSAMEPPKSLEDGARGWRLAEPPGRCPGCGGPPEGFAPAGARVFCEESTDKRGRPLVATHTSDAEVTAYKDVLLVRSLLEGKSVATCRNWLETVAEHVRGGRIRADFQQIAGGFREHDGGEGDAGMGMGRSSASRPINTQNPSNLQDFHEAVGLLCIGRKTPSVREVVRAPDPGLPRRLREAADRLERGTFWRNSPPQPEDRARAARFRLDAGILEARNGERARSFGVADLSQAHARIAAEASQDPVMLRDFRAGVDFHLSMAHRLSAAEDPSLTFEEAVRAFGDKSHPKHRLIKARRKPAKNANYGGFNLQGAPTLMATALKAAEPIVEPLEVWERVKAEWSALYAHFCRFQRSTIRAANRWRHRFDHIGVDGEYGEVRALTGRRLFLQKDWHPPRGDRDGYLTVKGTDCVSAVWMMTEADVVKFAMGNILRDFDAHPEWGAVFANMAHDEVDFECWADCAPEVAEAVQRRFHEAMRWGGVVSVPVDEPGAELRSSSLIKESWASK